MQFRQENKSSLEPQWQLLNDDTDDDKCKTLWHSDLVRYINLQGQAMSRTILHTILFGDPNIGRLDYARRILYYLGYLHNELTQKVKSIGTDTVDFLKDVKVYDKDERYRELESMVKPSLSQTPAVLEALAELITQIQRKINSLNSYVSFSQKFSEMPIRDAF
jgi:hypothetical protein